MQLLWVSLQFFLLPFHISVYINSKHYRVQLELFSLTSQKLFATSQKCFPQTISDTIPSLPRGTLLGSNFSHFLAAVFIQKYMGRNWVSVLNDSDENPVQMNSSSASKTPQVGGILCPRSSHSFTSAQTSLRRPQLSS